MEATKIKFSGLNGMRFIAACLVLFGHAKLISPALTAYESNPIWNLLFNNATPAVTFFFVLSGFLITYLLLNEQQRTQTISIKKFYFKRALRIFPLYYGLVFLFLIFIPLISSILNKRYTPFTFEQFLLYVLFLPNMVNPLAKLTHLWSIGVEEQFYLIWAPVMKYLKKALVPFILFLIGFRLVLDYTILKNYSEHFGSSNAENWIRFAQSIQIHSMGIGALGAWLLFYYPNKIKNTFFFNPIIQVLIYSLILARFAFNTSYFSVNTLFNNAFILDVLYPFLFLCLLLQVSLNPRTFISFKSPIWEYLGDLSFGIYMFHLPFIYLINPFFANLRHISFLSPLFIFYVTILLTASIFLAYLSFERFEKLFKRFRPQ